jgi:hypothetical protein
MIDYAYCRRCRRLTLLPRGESQHTLGRSSAKEYAKRREHDERPSRVVVVDFNYVTDTHPAGDVVERTGDADLHCGFSLRGWSLCWRPRFAACSTRLGGWGCAAPRTPRHALLELRPRRWPPGVIESGEASP